MIPGLKVDLKRIAGYIASNNLWSKRFCDLSQAEIESISMAIVHITGTWPPDIRRIINWLRDPATVLPNGFELGQALIVKDGAVFKARLLEDVSAGPQGPRAYYGAVQAELRRVYFLFGPPDGQDEVPF